jgi:hypothetical protein
MFRCALIMCWFNDSFLSCWSTSLDRFLIGTDIFGTDIFGTDIFGTDIFGNDNP